MRGGRYTFRAAHLWTPWLQVPSGCNQSLFRRSLTERTGVSGNAGKLEGTVTGRPDVICLKLLILKSITPDLATRELS